MQSPFFNPYSTNFECKECGNSFSSIESLDQHQKTHQTLNSHIQVCPTWQGDESSSFVSSNDEDLSCKCGKTFKTVLSLSNHKQTCGALKQSAVDFFISQATGPRLGSISPSRHSPFHFVDPLDSIVTFLNEPSETSTSTAVAQPMASTSNDSKIVAKIVTKTRKSKNPFPFNLKKCQDWYTLIYSNVSEQDKFNGIFLLDALYAYIESKYPEIDRLTLKLSRGGHKSIHLPKQDGPELADFVSRFKQLISKPAKPYPYQEPSDHWYKLIRHIMGQDLDKYTSLQLQQVRQQFFRHKYGTNADKMILETGVGKSIYIMPCKDDEEFAQFMQSHLRTPRQSPVRRNLGKVVKKRKGSYDLDETEESDQSIEESESEQDFESSSSESASITSNHCKSVEKSDGEQVVTRTTSTRIRRKPDYYADFVPVEVIDRKRQASTPAPVESVKKPRVRETSTVSENSVGQDVTIVQETVQESPRVQSTSVLSTPSRSFVSSFFKNPLKRPELFNQVETAKKPELDQEPEPKKVESKIEAKKQEPKKQESTKKSESKKKAEPKKTETSKEPKKTETTKETKKTTSKKKTSKKPEAKKLESKSSNQTVKSPSPHPSSSKDIKLDQLLLMKRAHAAEERLKEAQQRQHELLDRIHRLEDFVASALKCETLEDVKSELLKVFE